MHPVRRNAASGAGPPRRSIGSRNERIGAIVHIQECSLRPFEQYSFPLIHGSIEKQRGIREVGRQVSCEIAHAFEQVVARNPFHILRKEVRLLAQVIGNEGPQRLRPLAVADGDDDEMALSEQPLVRGVSEEGLAALQRHLTPRTFAAGQFIVRQGDPASHMYFITQGRASVVVGDPFKPAAVVARVHAGLCVGEMAMIERKPRSASVRADTETTCHELPFAALDAPELAEVRHQMVANLAVDLSQRLRQRNAEIWNLT